MSLPPPVSIAALPPAIEVDHDDRNAAIVAGIAAGGERALGLATAGIGGRIATKDVVHIEERIGRSPA